MTVESLKAATREPESGNVRMMSPVGNFGGVRVGSVLRMEPDSQYTISVVIPSRGRPQLLRRAIRSVLAQTFQDLEIIVVLDGVDASSATAVEEFNDARIRLLTLPQRAGGNVARNAGVAASRGDWIAFLDDDDEFPADKLVLQLECAKSQTSADTGLTVCKAQIVGGADTPIWPERFPKPEERLVDYLFCRTGLRQGEAFLQSSTYFISRRLAVRIPFRHDLGIHQDWDWIIRLQTAAGVRIVGVPQALTMYHRGEGPSVSKRNGWQESLNWARDMVLPQSRRSYSFFIATQCVTRLDGQQCWRWAVLRHLARECFSVGKVDRTAFALFAGFWIRALYKSLVAHGTGIRTH